MGASCCWGRKREGKGSDGEGERDSVQAQSRRRGWIRNWYVSNWGGGGGGRRRVWTGGRKEEIWESEREEIKDGMMAVLTWRGCEEGCFPSCSLRLIGPCLSGVVSLAPRGILYIFYFSFIILSVSYLSLLSFVFPLRPSHPTRQGGGGGGDAHK